MVGRCGDVSILCDLMSGRHTLPLCHTLYELGLLKSTHAQMELFLFSGCGEAAEGSKETGENSKEKGREGG
jgi:hypothetical protein